MRKAFIILTGMLFTLLFATCTQFTADIDGYLSYWASEAYITDSSIKAVLQNDLNSIPSVPSAEDVSVTFKLQNPKSFSLDLPPAAAPAKKVIVFEHLTQAPVAGTDYTLTQSEDRQSLTLTYKASFLQAHEWGAQDLSSTLSLYAVDGRPFKQIYTLKLKANTPPQNPSFTVAKTTGSPAYYVLCITIPDMDKRVPGGLLHKDLARIEVNGTSYSFSVNEAQKAFTKPESDSFITHSDVAKLSEPDADEVPTDGWVLYYKTDVEVKDGAAKKDYTIKLIDERGLASDILNASTKPNKAENETIRIVKGTKISGSGSESDPIVIGTGSAGAELSVSSTTTNTTVYCTVSEIGGSTPVKYDGNPVTVPLPLNGAGEKKYKLEYYTDGEGLAATPVQTVYYKVVQGHTVSFDANGGVYPDGTTVVSKIALHGATVSAPDVLPKKQGFRVTGWYKDKACSAGQAWNFETDMVTGDMTLYAQWTAGAVSYKVEHYQQNINDNNYPSSPTDTDKPTGTTGANAAVTLKNYPGFETGTYTAATIAADGSTVVKVYYKRKIISVMFNPNGGTIDGSGDNKTVSGKYGAPLTAPTAEYTGHNFSGWKPMPPAPQLPSTFPAENAEYTAQWDLNSYTVTFSVEIVDGEAGGTITATPEGGSATSSSPVSVEYGKKVTFTADPTNTDWEVAEWKKDNIVVNGTNSTYTLSNITENKEVTVKFHQSTLKNQATWKDLARAVKSAPDNATLTIDGEIKATRGTGNNGEIVINKNLTIKRATGASSAVIDANKDTGSKPKHRIFKVESDKTLTLENLTLKGGIAEMSDMDGSGGGVYVETSGKLIMTDSSITDCEAIGDTGTQKYGYGGGVYNKGTVKMTGGEIKNNKARVGGGIDNNGTLILTNATLTGNTATLGSALCMSSDSSGEMTGGKIISNTCSGSGDGGVYIHAGTFTLKSGASIESNTADYGGGAYVGQNGTLIINGGSIKLNKARRGGGVYVSGNSTKRGTLRMIQGDISDNGAGWNGTSYTGMGGGVYNNGVFEMTGGEIKDNKAQTGGGVYFSEGTFKMSGSAVVTPSTGLEANVKGKNDVYLKTGQAITVDGTLSNNPAARITPEEYKENVPVLRGGSGVTLKNETGKFIVPPQKVTVESEDWNVFWYIADNGNLKAEVENSSLLQEVISGRPNNTPFIIKLGDIDDLTTVEIPKNKKIMLKADREVTLTCPNNGHDHYKHLQVQRDATLILEGKIKLQGADYGDKDHYALCVEKDGNAEIKDGVTITGFKNTGRGTVFVDGNLTMSGGTITGNKARNKGDGTAYDDGKGGGVYICPDRSFTMTGGTISDNEAGNGGGVYVSADHDQFMYGNFIMKGGTIKNNKATVSSVYSYIEYTGHGGGVCTQGNFEMKGGTITGNQSERNCKAVQAENDFYWYSGDITDNGGANQAVSGKKAVANRNDSIYYFHNKTKPHKDPS